MRLGNTQINKAYLGPNEVAKIYVGSAVVFDQTAEQTIEGAFTVSTDDPELGANVTFTFVPSSINFLLSANDYSLVAGDSLVLSAVSTLTYQLRWNGVPVSGLTNAVNTITDWQESDDGAYTLLVTDTATNDTRVFGPLDVNVSGGGPGLSGLISASSVLVEVGDVVTLTFDDTSIAGSVTASDDTPTEGDVVTLEFVPVVNEYQWIDGNDGTDIVGQTALSTNWTAAMLPELPPRIRVTNPVSGQSVVFNPPAITVEEAPALLYTSPTRYSVMGNGLRWTVTSQSQATNRFMAIEWRILTPDYETSEHRVFCPSFWTPSGAEVYLAGGASILIEGWSIETSPGVWTACDGASETGVATVDNSSAGAWLPRVNVTLAANSSYRARMTFVVSATSVLIPRNSAVPGTGSPTGIEPAEGNTSTRFSRLSSGTVSNGGGVAYHPSIMIAKGGDGRPAILAVGDSIGHGLSVARAWDDRRTVGYIDRGLDENVTSLRLAYHNSCCPGNRPAGTDGWDNASNWAGKRAAFQAIYDQYGEWPFDFVLSQHITNAIPYSADGGDLKIGMGRYFDLLAGWGKPITQIEGLPKATSTDGYSTVINQTPSSGSDYPTAGLGHLWTFNSDAGTDGLPDAAKHYRTAGKIEDSIGAWRSVSADLTTNRHKWAVRPFNTTLTTAYASGNTIITADAPEIGASLSLEQDASGWSAPRVVANVTGTGPYTVTLQATMGTGSAIGMAVRETASDSLHPSAWVAHNLIAPEIVAWKVRRGWV